MALFCKLSEVPLWKVTLWKKSDFMKVLSFYEKTWKIPYKQEQ